MYRGFCEEIFRIFKYVLEEDSFFWHYCFTSGFRGGHFWEGKIVLNFPFFSAMGIFRVLNRC